MATRERSGDCHGDHHQQDERDSDQEKNRHSPRVSQVAGRVVGSPWGTGSATAEEKALYAAARRTRPRSRSAEAGTPTWRWVAVQGAEQTGANWSLRAVLSGSLQVVWSGGFAPTGRGALHPFDVRLCCRRIHSWTRSQAALCPVPPKRLW